ncbi:hypothetical protein BGZ65_004032, partial [Modicella reniformis]
LARDSRMRLMKARWQLVSCRLLAHEEPPSSGRHISLGLQQGQSNPLFAMWSLEFRILPKIHSIDEQFLMKDDV